MSKELIIKLTQRSINTYPNYIRQIRFPFFKKLKKNSEINFDYPFTVLVGPNGSGKSSTLQALYGCPAKNNVAHYWFSTAIDPIKESGDEAHRYIYKYKPAKYPDEIEILQLRRKRDNDPDYWETARPRKADGMESMPDYEEKYEHLRTKTRWKKMVKNVVYIDFRAELSAFDKFFYFGTFSKTEKIESPQDFLRFRSTKLKAHINNFNGKALYWHTRSTESIDNLTDEELKWTNQILGKHYISAKIVKHNFFNNDGYSIIFTNNDDSYSEAVAGSGEVSVVNCVVKVLRAPKESLILLDEPEVSLHPGAQTELRSLLLSKILESNCQVIMSTHSEHFVQSLPDRAIKLYQFEDTTNSYTILNDCSPEQAFIRLGSSLHNSSKKKVYVEDELAKNLVIKAIKEIDEKSLTSFDIVPYPGGACTMLNNLLVHFAASEVSTNDIVLLDGDMIKSIHISETEQYKGLLDSGRLELKRYSQDIPKSSYNDLDNILKTQIGIDGKSFKLPLNGGNASNAEQAIKFKLRILNIYHEKFNFMNVDTPEEFIWEIATDDNNGIMNIDTIKNTFTQPNYKDKFVGLTKSMHGGQSDSRRIFDTQMMFLHKRDKKHPDWIKFKKLIQSILSLQPIGA
ncbi:ATP-dependent nuclease [Photobacterium damselae]|uniref:ATP-dependent nuclease n=1 Tax=Photobacterium damselae TaxID=38293 RepID=UPI001EFEAF74|nr:ATP-binding protein [Photobacterium damselae]MCG9704577.1 ATP-binding protein [Photobacterium damselae]